MSSDDEYEVDKKTPKTRQALILNSRARAQHLSRQIPACGVCSRRDQRSNLFIKNHPHWTGPHDRHPRETETNAKRQGLRRKRDLPPPSRLSLLAGDLGYDFKSDPPENRQEVLNCLPLSHPSLLSWFSFIGED
ncbi:lysine-2,3-aminomutase [Anopheles sinensis]|uniref:Lysine-2,3-aminomutase n=1 Tax=Anopheles sinensis TaxID=74873 RepID=A0A084VLG5_ANOSI|nr:lysine-2,3-aminomutase [Anopheles sinensis]